MLEQRHPHHQLRPAIRSCIISISSPVRSVSGERTGPVANPRRRTPALTALTASCALMLKFEWPLIEPENEQVALLSRHTFDVAEYVVRLSKDTGLAPIDPMAKTIS